MTTIFFDFNNLVIRCVFNQDVCQKDTYGKLAYIDWEHWKYLVFSSVYGSLNHTKNCKEIILAVDHRRSWRKDVWERYKESRKKKRDKKDFPWDEFFIKYEELQEEFKAHFPFKMLMVDKTEADDIIGVLVLKNEGQSQIISADKDFLQLYDPKNVSIYNPMKKMNVSHPNPEMFIVEECLKGQAKDDIFNIKTPLDWPVGKRKPGFGPKALDKVIAYGWKQWLKDEDLQERYEFNRDLMDFRRIPEDIKKRITDEYEGYDTPHPEKIYEFFKQHNWPEYLENLTNVENRLYVLY